MKNWFNKNYKTLIIGAFLVPIVTVAIVSISHVTKWYGISNPISWAVYLSIGIEIAALSALAAISADMGKKVYFPFAIVTIIQFIGNIFFAYSYININSQEFKDWVDLVSPLVSFMGVEPTDFVGHKRFLSFFAGGMLPIISLSFLHMLVKFTEEDRNKEENVTEETPKINASDLIGEVSKVRLTENDLRKLEEVLLNPPKPNNNLDSAAVYYKQKVAENQKIQNEVSKINSTPISREETSIQIEDRNLSIEEPETISNEERKEILSKMMEEDQELGLYDEDWGGITNDELIGDDEIVSTIEPTLEEEEQNFSTIEPNLENNFQNNEDDNWEIQISETVVPIEEITKEEINEVLNLVQSENFSQEETTLNPIGEEKKN